MMELILLRHGKAENFNMNGDFQRELLDKGREQARRASRILNGAGLLPEIVLTSPLIRARQTADEFCAHAKIPGPVIQGWLAAGMAPESAMAELAAFRDFKRVAIVGHEPDFSILVEWILGVTGGGVEFKKGAIACLRITPPTRFGNLLYLIPQKLAGEIDAAE
ncbi:MAG: histidine phosphatase family protein [Akkermansiaceae bacterium]